MTVRNPLLVLSAIVSLVACKGNESAPPAGSAKPASAPASATAAAAVATGKPTGSPAELHGIKLPTPAGVPSGAQWKPVGGLQKTGYRFENLNADGDKNTLLQVTLWDCREAGIGADPSSDYSMCTNPPSDKLFGYPVKKRDGDPPYYQLRVGNIWLKVNTFSDKGKPKIAAADIEKWIQSLDLSGIAKL